MYIIKYKNKNHDEIISGDFPTEYLQELWRKGIKFIVISKYSNTIKVPRPVDYNDYGENLIDYDEYPL